MKKQQFYSVVFVSVFLLVGNVLYAQNMIFTPGGFQPRPIKAIDLTKDAGLSKIPRSSFYRSYYNSDAYKKTNQPEPQTAADINQLTPQDTYALPWAGIQWVNILWKKRVWRTIDTRESKNSSLSNSADIPANKSLVHILIEGFFSGKYKAYSAVDDRFTTELTQQDVVALLTNKKDAQPGSANAGFNPDQVTKFKIKEDWLYLDTQRIVVVRILGIAPVREVTAPDGSVTEQPLFWLYYPYIRSYLAQQKVYGASNSAPDYNWDKLFENRDFSGKIDKISKPYHPSVQQNNTN